MFTSMITDNELKNCTKTSFINRSWKNSKTKYWKTKLFNYSHRTYNFFKILNYLYIGT